VFLSIATTSGLAPDLGYVLYKHPDRIFEKSNTKGRVVGFFPENSPERAEFSIFYEVDPVERVRGVSYADGIAQYVEPYPYLAASHLSSAISTALRSAMNGILGSTDPEIDARVKESGGKAWPLELKFGPVRSSPSLVQRMFGPLGWEVSVESTPLPDDHVSDPTEGNGHDIHTVTIKGNLRSPPLSRRSICCCPHSTPNATISTTSPKSRSLSTRAATGWTAIRSAP
jgi:hypothetical protein